MSTEKELKKLTETSPSVQTHLGILQGVIDRMATNSTSAKAWCITLVSAILVIVADKSKPEYAFIALLPTLLFAALDTYYLAHEKGFIASYNYFVRKIHDGELLPDDLYSVRPRGDSSAHQFEALQSFSIWGFYLVMIIMIILARCFVLS